jgi:hypothetical protein
MPTGLHPATSGPSGRKPDKRLYLPLREVTEMFDVSRSTIVRSHQSGNFPLVKIRGTYRVPRLFVDDFNRAARLGPLVVLEDFAASWIARHGMPEAVAS